MKRLEITGQKFGWLTAIEYLEDSLWRFKCGCGKEYIARASAVKNGRIKSCGCAARARQNSRFKKSSYAVLGRFAGKFWD